MADLFHWYKLPRAKYAVVVDRQGRTVAERVPPEIAPLLAESPNLLDVCKAALEVLADVEGGDIDFGFPGWLCSKAEEAARRIRAAVRRVEEHKTRQAEGGT